MNALLRWPGSLLSPAGARGKLQILIYHRVLREADPLLSEPDVETFRWQMRMLAEQFNVLPLSEAVERLQKNTLPARAACITFDDGYADNAEVALPVLKEFNLPATFFIATGFLNGGIMWNERIVEVVRQATGSMLDLSGLGMARYETGDTSKKLQAIKMILPALKHLPFAERAEKVTAIVELSGAKLPDDMMMSDAQVRQLKEAGMEIGGHTVNHPILAKLDIREAEREIADGRDYLEHLLREPVSLFAYPNGKPGQDYTCEHVALVKKLGFRAAVSTHYGVSRAGVDYYQLPRFTPWDKTRLRFLLRLYWNALMKDEAALR